MKSGASSERKIRMIRNGIYRYNAPEGGYIDIEVHKDSEMFSFRLIENTCRLSHALIELMLNNSDRIEINKLTSPHSISFSQLAENWFVIYPYRMGISYLFELQKGEGK